MEPPEIVNYDYGMGSLNYRWQSLKRFGGTELFTKLYKQKIDIEQKSKKGRK